MNKVYTAPVRGSKTFLMFNKYMKIHIISVGFAQEVVERMLVVFSDEYQM